MLIALVNQSTKVTDAQAQVMAALVNFQLRQHVAPAWGLALPSVVFYPAVDGVVPGAANKILPAGSAAIGILDNADQAGDLGWHTEAEGGVVYGRVFAGPTLEQPGAAVLSGPLSVSSVASHEVIETFLDSACDLWADNGNGTSYAREGCDAVESDSYPLLVRTAAGVEEGSVSDFLLPGWFDPQSPGPFDWMRLCTAPFEVRKTGYTITMTDGQVAQSFGEEYPDWRRAAKGYPIARTARRARQGRH